MRFAEIRAAVIARLADVDVDQILAYPPGENMALRESVHVRDVSARYEWRAIGRPSAGFARRNRTEQLTVTLRVHVYREAPDQGDAVNAAHARLDAIVEQIVDAIADDPSLGDTVSHALVESVTAEQPDARQSGWSVTGTVRVDALHHPA